MAFWSRKTPITETVVEAAPVAAQPNTNPRGFVFGVPRGGTTETNQGGTTGTGTDRRTELDELWQAYLACPWSSACVDTVARTITAGGVEIAWDGGTDNEQDAPEPPPNVVAARELLDYVNPREDIRQLMRGVLADLQVFGDAYIEVVWIGSTPAALYSLDVPSMNILSDEHGTITGYVQVTEQGQRAEFEPREVIHFTLDSPRTGVIGVSPTKKALLPITTWLFTAATLKETMRKGDPANLHVDFPESMSESDIKVWRQKYQVNNLGARNIGTPVTTRGGATVSELKAYALENYLRAKDQARDEILSTYGVPPSKVGVIESGNLGGGTGTSQDKTFRVNTCGPYAEEVLEKLTFHLLRVGFGIFDWVMRFGEFDWRDDKTVDDIHSQRVRDGRWTLNRARAEINEPPVDGGDDAVLIDRQNLVLWASLKDYSDAEIDSKNQTAIAAGVVAPKRPHGTGVAASSSAAAPSTTGARDDQKPREAWRQHYLRHLTEMAEELPTLEGADW